MLIILAKTTVGSTVLCNSFIIIKSNCRVCHTIVNIIFIYMHGLVHLINRIPENRIMALNVRFNDSEKNQSLLLNK